MYIKGREVLHMFKEASYFQVVRLFDNVTSICVWDMLKYCWIDTNVKLTDYLIDDVGKDISCHELVVNVAAMFTSTKSVPVEAHWPFGLVERYQVQQRAFKIICEELKVIHPITNLSTNGSQGPQRFSWS